MVEEEGGCKRAGGSVIEWVRVEALAWDYRWWNQRLSCYPVNVINFRLLPMFALPPILKRGRHLIDNSVSVCLAKRGVADFTHHPTTCNLIAFVLVELQHVKHFCTLHRQIISRVNALRWESQCHFWAWCIISFEIPWFFTHQLRRETKIPNLRQMKDSLQKGKLTLLWERKYIKQSRLDACKRDSMLINCIWFF